MHTTHHPSSPLHTPRILLPLLGAIGGPDVVSSEEEGQDASAPADAEASGGSLLALSTKAG